MDALTEILGGEPAMPAWVYRLPEGRPTEWVPRPGGLLAEEQRRLRRCIEASGSGVPEEWEKVEGQGCPGWWMRLAVDTAWAWRLTKIATPLRAKIEAFTVASIPTPRWASVLQRGVAWKLMEDPEVWTSEHASAWDAALRDTAAAAPVPFAWVGEGLPLPASEGRGGAPWSWLLRSRDLRWEVLAATRSKAWLRFGGTVDFVDGIEESRVNVGLTRRERRKQRRLAREEAGRRPTPQWVIEYPARVKALRMEGMSLQEAHWTVSWEAGDRWVRQEGDTNYYGYPTCQACDQDEICGLCKYADDHGKFPQDLFFPDYHWSNLTSDELWGSKEWEAQVLEAYGFLDTARDPEPWPGADDEGQQPPGAVGGQQVAENGGEAGEEAAAANEDSEVEGEGSESEGSSMGSPPGNWGEPQQAGEEWNIVP